MISSEAAGKHKDLERLEILRTFLKICIFLKPNF